MGKEVSINKIRCVKCQCKNIERVDDFFSSASDPKYDRVLQTIVCEKCGWVGVAIYRLELIYAGEENARKA